MRNTLSRLPWRMTLLWAGLFAVLARVLPPPCHVIRSNGHQHLVGISDDAQSIVFADVVTSPAGGIPDYTGQFSVIDAATGAQKVISATLPSEERVVFVRVAGRFLWLDCRSGEGKRSVTGVRRFLTSPSSPPGGVATLRAFDLDSGTEIEALRSHSIGGLLNTQFSQDGSRMLSVNLSGPAILVRDVLKRRSLCMIEYAEDFRILSPDGKFLAVFSSTVRAEPLRTVGEWRIYDVATGLPLARRHQTQRHDRAAMAAPLFEHLRFADDGETLISYGAAVESPSRTIWHWRSGLVTSDSRVSRDLTDFGRLQSRARVGQIVDDSALGQRWTLLTSGESTLKDRILRVAGTWLPISWRGVTNQDLGFHEVWDVTAGRCILRLPGLFAATHLSNNAARMIRFDGHRLEVWALPAKRSWGWALLGSLVVPLAWGIRRQRSLHGRARRRPEMAVPQSRDDAEAPRPT